MLGNPVIYGQWEDYGSVYSRGIMAAVHVWDPAKPRYSSSQSSVLRTPLRWARAWRLAVRWALVKIRRVKGVEISFSAARWRVRRREEL